MESVALTLQVDDKTARHFESISEQEREEVLTALSGRLEELASGAGARSGAELTGTKLSGAARLARLQQARGLWKDRGDLPPQDELRRSMDRRGLDQAS